MLQHYVLVITTLLLVVAPGLCQQYEYVGTYEFDSTSLHLIAQLQTNIRFASTNVTRPQLVISATRSITLQQILSTGSKGEIYLKLNNVALPSTVSLGSINIIGQFLLYFPFFLALKQVTSRGQLAAFVCLAGLSTVILADSEIVLQVTIEYPNGYQFEAINLDIIDGSVASEVGDALSVQSIAVSIQSVTATVSLLGPLTVRSSYDITSQASVELHSLSVDPSAVGSITSDGPITINFIEGSQVQGVIDITCANLALPLSCLITHQDAQSDGQHVLVSCGNNSSTVMLTLSTDSNVTIDVILAPECAATNIITTAAVGTTPGLAIPPNFFGISHEWGDGQGIMGWVANGGVNYIYRHLLLPLLDGHWFSPFLIRIGGGSTDAQGYPVAGDISKTQALNELRTYLTGYGYPVQFTLGVNMRNGSSSLAQAQLSAYLTQMAPNSIAAFEIGNEPDNYGYNGYRPREYSYGISDSYVQEFGQFRAALRPLAPSNITFMGGSWGIFTRIQYFSNFVDSEKSYVKLASHHYYSGYHDGKTNFTEDFLLDPTKTSSAPQFLVDVSAVQMAHSNGMTFRIGEMNSIDGGGVGNISDTFQSALWAPDLMFELAKIGVDGVNWHWAATGIYSPAHFNASWVNGNYVYNLVRVNPEYYGQLLFQQATKEQAKFLPVTVNAGPRNIKVWAVQDRKGIVRIVLINKEKATSGNIRIELPGYGTANVTRLLAPSYKAKSGVTWGGQTFDGSPDGNIVGAQQLEYVRPSCGGYTIKMPVTSAALLQIAK